MAAALLVAACASGEVTVNTDVTVSGSSTSTTSVAPVPTSTRTDTTLRGLTVPPHHVTVFGVDIAPGYVFRTELQLAFGAAWGNGSLYIADQTGRRVVAVGVDGTLSDTGLWQTSGVFADSGPNDVAIGPDGQVYVAAGERTYRVDGDGNVQIAAPLGGFLAFGPDGRLYISDGGDSIFVMENEEPILVTSGLEQPYFISVDSQGLVYVVELPSPIIKRLDPATGTLSDFYDAGYLGVGDWELAFIAVDADGDVWIRGKGVMAQISSDGDRVPFSVDGVETEVYEFPAPGMTLAGGLAFDDQGGLWVASLPGGLMHFAPDGTGGFTTETIADAFVPSSIAVDDRGNVFAHDTVSGNLMQLGSDGPETVWSTGPADLIDVAADPTSDLLYVAVPGEILTIDTDGSVSHYAAAMVSRITLTADGTLYGIEVDDDGLARSILQFDREISRVLTTQLAGDSMVGQSLRIGAAPDSLYVLSTTNNTLYRVGFDGTSTAVADAASAPGQLPYYLAVSPQGTAYLLGYDNYRVDGATLVLVSTGTIGDPISAAFASDGSVLYVAEMGVISRIPLP